MRFYGAMDTSKSSGTVETRQYLCPLLRDRNSPVRENGDHWYCTRIGGKRGCRHGARHRKVRRQVRRQRRKSGGFPHATRSPRPSGSSELRGSGGEKEAAPESPAAAIEAQSGLYNAHRVRVIEEGMKFISTMIPLEGAIQNHEKPLRGAPAVEQLMIGFIRQTIGP